MIQCYYCAKTHQSGQNVPHSKQKTKRLIRANLQIRKVAGKRIRVCTKCIKSYRTVQA